MPIVIDPIARPRTKTNPFGAKKNAYRRDTHTTTVAPVSSSPIAAIPPRRKKLTVSADVSNSFDSQVSLPSRPGILINPFEDEDPSQRRAGNSKKATESNRKTVSDVIKQKMDSHDFSKKKQRENQSSNPFDSPEKCNDFVEDKTPLTSKKNSNQNPFEDEDDAGGSSNPFEDNYKESNNPFD